MYCVSLHSYFCLASHCLCRALLSPVSRWVRAFNYSPVSVSISSSLSSSSLPAPSAWLILVFMFSIGPRRSVRVCSYSAVFSLSKALKNRAHWQLLKHTVLFFYLFFFCRRADVSCVFVCFSFGCIETLGNGCSGSGKSQVRIINKTGIIEQKTHTVLEKFIFRLKCIYVGISVMFSLCDFRQLAKLNWQTMQPH